MAEKKTAAKAAKPATKAAKPAAAKAAKPASKTSKAAVKAQPRLKALYNKEYKAKLLKELLQIF